MTTRAVILGLVGAATICALTYFNDHVIRQTYLVGTNMPTGIYGGLVVFLLLVNPAIAYLRRRSRFTGAELAVIMALMLAACCIPSAGLMETFPDAIMMPHHQAKSEPGWQEEGIVRMAPDYMLADVEGNEQEALNGYVQGLSTGSEHIGFADVPWSAWVRTMAFWLPLVLLVWVGLIGLSVVLHRQWSRHEQLPYPIAAFTSSLLPDDGPGAGGSVLRSRLFWAGAATVLAVHLVNYAHTWWPDALVRIPRQFDFVSLSPIFPTFMRGGGWGLLRPIVFFTVVGFAYLLPTAVSFSLGIGPFIYFYLAGVLAGYGISMAGGGWYEPNLARSLQAGAYVGIMMMILYTGRYYYRNVFCRALGLASREDVEAQAVWGARVFLVCVGLFVAELILVGLDWQLAVIYTVLMVGIFVVIGRISAETGYFFIQPYWGPGVLIVGFMGARALGPSTALVIFMVSTVVLMDTREALVPFLLNSFKVLDERKVRVGRTAALGVAALVVGLAAAVPVTLYFKYDRGTDMTYGWASKMVPRFPFEQTLKIKQRLAAQGELAESESTSGWGRFAAASPDRTALVGFGVGVVLVLLLSAGRLRIPGWPLHPVLLLLWTTYPGYRFAASFLIGCSVKWAVVKYGGDATYRGWKPVMFGLIAGDMLAGVGASVVGGVYYLVTGKPPERFVVLVG